ncbi:MAG TPA: hypothetical protein VMD53_18810 [Rhizomicrobium sp.]|nr:hypothetical protein [Rhizomicrobium sp.]
MSDSPLAPFASLATFFSALAPNDRAWLAISCSMQLDGNYRHVEDGQGAANWFEQYFASASDPELRFGRLIALLAVIDFELSETAIARTAARAQRMTTRSDEFLAKTGHDMLQDMLPRLVAMSEAWRDARDHQLDEAALWICRDEIQRLAAAQSLEEMRRIQIPLPPGSP